MAALSAGYKPCRKLFNRYTLAHTLLAQMLIGLVVVKSVGPHQMNDGLYDYPSSAKPPAGSRKFVAEMSAALVFIECEKQ
jgi:hypothetical protein